MFSHQPEHCNSHWHEGYDKCPWYYIPSLKEYLKGNHLISWTIFFFLFFIFLFICICIVWVMSAYKGYDAHGSRLWQIKDVFTSVCNCTHTYATSKFLSSACWPNLVDGKASLASPPSLSWRTMVTQPSWTSTTWAASLSSSTTLDTTTLYNRSTSTGAEMTQWFLKETKKTRSSESGDALFDFIFGT